jgi:predicted metalloprotease
MRIREKLGVWAVAVSAMVVVGAAPAQATEEPAAPADGQATAQTTAPPTAPPTTLIGVDGAFIGSMYDFQVFWFTDVANWWQAQGVGPFAYYRFPAPGEWFPSPCGDGPNDLAAFYCSADDTVVFSQAMATRIWEGTLDLTGQYGGQAAGDMGVVYVLAHEYAHNVQFEQGLLSGGLPVVNTELHADCWAGVYARAKQDAGQLDATDIPEAIATVARVGDYDYTNPQFHGTPEQRVAAFEHGLASGRPAACDVVLHGAHTG